MTDSVRDQLAAIIAATAGKWRYRCEVRFAETRRSWNAPDDLLEDAIADAVLESGLLTRPSDAIVISRHLLESLVDPDDCWFDHHGGCQAHCYLSLEPGELCPHEEAKRVLRAVEVAGIPPNPEQEETP